MMLRCSTSLWSADLVNLESEIKRVEPFSERFHLDVADGHFTPTLLFFPDLASSDFSMSVGVFSVSGVFVLDQALGVIMPKWPLCSRPGPWGHNALEE